MTETTTYIAWRSQLDWKWKRSMTARCPLGDPFSEESNLSSLNMISTEVYSFSIFLSFFYVYLCVLGSCSSINDYNRISKEVEEVLAKPNLQNHCEELKKFGTEWQSTLQPKLQKIIKDAELRQELNSSAMGLIPATPSPSPPTASQAPAGIFFSIILIILYVYYFINVTF